MASFTHKNRSRVLASGLALALTFGGASHAQADTEFNANFKIPGFLSGKPLEIVVPVDCDLLGPNGEKTIEFVKQFGIWGHIKNETNVTAAENHLRSHGITSDKIENVRKYCLEHY